ncbi:MAG TPA: glucosamine-6-phosphate deaminase [Acidobacteriota bacterium]|nr:glucosamine-6-phosphate deaminase [Acidobacteriota bacterium]
MEIFIHDTPQAATRAAARTIAGLLGRKPEAVLGLATGDTMLALYDELVGLHRDEGLDFSRVTTFNLDEYVGLPPEHPDSYHSFMRERLFDRVNIRPQAVHIPDGQAADLSQVCVDYEEAIQEAGGIDLQLLGIGRNGHIGFNEPSSSLASRTRVTPLARQTLKDNRCHFHEEPMPSSAITMGIGTILQARQCLLLAFGSAKAKAVARAAEGPVTTMVPASALQFHPDCRFLLDPAAASKLKNQAYYASQQSDS